MFATGANIPDLRVVHRNDRHGVRGNLLRDHLSHDGHRQHRLQPHRGHLPHPRCWIIRGSDHFKNWFSPPGLYLWNGIALCSSTASVVTWMVQFYLRLTHNLLIREYRSTTLKHFCSQYYFKGIYLALQARSSSHSSLRDGSHYQIG